VRLPALRRLVSIAAVLACAGCGAAKNFSPGVVYPPPAAAPPLKLCPIAASAPHAVVSQLGFTMLTVSATDAAHQPIGGLTQAGFEVHSGASAYPIAYFHADDGAAPESIAIVIDTSGSMHPKLPVVEQALGGFLTKRNPCDEVAVYAFSDRPYLLLPFTTDHQAAVQRLSTLRANGETALYDSIATAIAYQQKSAHYPDRAIVLITDGIDNHSKMTQSDLVAQSKASGVRMFLIGIGDPNASTLPGIAIGPFVVNGSDMERVDAKAINSLADATGGEAFIVPTVANKDDDDAFGKAVASIGAALGHGYSLGVILPPGVAASSVTVAVPSHPDAVVTTRPAPAAKSP